LIADVQYADIPNARSPYGAMRSYRDALNKVRFAVKDWVDQSCVLAVDLGDTIDRRSGAAAALARDTVMSNFQGFAPVLHILGNHDLSALPPPHPQLLDTAGGHAALGHLDIDCGPGGYCCDIQVGLGWRIIVLDTYDVAVRRNAVEARALRTRLLQESRQEGICAAYLTEHEELNGAVGEKQIDWLRERLELARESMERTVVLAHAPLQPEATYFGDAACWNCQEVSDLLDCFPDVVALVVTGHDHYGGEVVSKGGIHHRVLEAAMEGAKGVPTHALLELCPGSPGLQMVGRGAVRHWKPPDLTGGEM